MQAKNVLLIILLFLFQAMAAQDGKLSWYYPKLTDVNPQQTIKKGSSILNTHAVAGCVTGNCKTGTGEYLKATVADDPKQDASGIFTGMNLTLYKGKFSNDGKNFEGTVYTQKVYYDLVYKKDDPKLIPKTKYDISEESFWKPGEVASGMMESAGSAGYKWHGWMETATKPGTVIAAGQPNSFKAHFISDKAHVKIKYAAGGAYTEVEGRALTNGDILGGRIHFSDGSVYEGFLQKGKRFGPGRYILKDGKKEEGIWMLDSLAMPMVVNLPKDLFEPVTGVPVIAAIAYGGYPTLEFMDAGNGWVYSFYTNALYMGKMENGKLDGPGFMFTNSEGRVFRTGNFKDGKLVSGMKVRDDKYTYGGEYTTVITGNFKDDQLIPSCSKLIRYDAMGKPVRMIEGFIYPSKNFNKEFADGWAYVNDWEGKRDPANLQYLYNGEDYLNMSGQPNYVSWFTKGLKESETATYCFSSMKAQAAPILAMMKYRHDSVVVVASKRDADIAANKAAWAKREVDRKAACDIEKGRYDFKQGDYYQIGEGFDPATFMIAGTVDCILKRYLVLKRSWVQTTSKKGYWQLSTPYLSGEEIKKYKKIGANFSICTKCNGAGAIPVTEYHEVGGDSGYTAVGGGWAVKNPETYWKVEAWHQCKVCSGKGFIGK
ncbi:hypothetical protein CAP36_15775 [Chitinophagaceae bacterium IBVUCB2]|nr:hypothetical protein CAP36_15775 [Chitinophagaceae bacterium IBVUCB2]